MNAIKEVGVTLSESGRDDTAITPPTQLVGKVWVVFSKRLLEDAREKPAVLDQIAEDARKRLRALLNDIPEEVVNEPPAD